MEEIPPDRSCIFAVRVPWLFCHLSEQKKVVLIRWSNFPPRGISRCFINYSAAMAIIDGCCLSDCHCIRIMTTSDMGRATTIGSTICPWWAEQGNLTEDCLADAQGFCFCCMEERCPEEPDDCTYDHAVESRFCRGYLCIDPDSERRAGRHRHRGP